MDFVGNLLIFTAVKEFCKLNKIDKVIATIVACCVIGSRCVLVYMLCDMTMTEAISQQRGGQRPRD